MDPGLLRCPSVAMHNLPPSSPSTSGLYLSSQQPFNQESTKSTFPSRLHPQPFKVSTVFSQHSFWFRQSCRIGHFSAAVLLFSLQQCPQSDTSVCAALSRNAVSLEGMSMRPIQPSSTVNYEAHCLNTHLPCRDLYKTPLH